MAKHTEATITLKVSPLLTLHHKITGKDAMFIVEAKSSPEGWDPFDVTRTSVSIRMSPDTALAFAHLIIEQNRSQAV